MQVRAGVQEYPFVVQFPQQCRIRFAVPDGERRSPGATLSIYHFRELTIPTECIRKLDLPWRPALRLEHIR